MKKDMITYRVAELWLRDQKTPSEIAEVINQEFPGTRLTRESVYPRLAEAVQREYIQFHPPVEETMSRDLVDRFELPAGSVRVVECPSVHSFAEVSAVAAEWAGELVKEIAAHRNISMVGVGLGPGSATLDFARRFGQVIADDPDAPDLKLVAITAGSPATRPQYASSTYFNLFPRAKVKEYIGFFAETFIPRKEFDRMKQEKDRRLGVRDAFAAKDDLQLVVTSMGGVDDEHSLFRKFHDELAELQGKGAKKLKWWDDCVGDCQYRPYSETEPINEGPDDPRASTLFELDELVRMAETRGKHVMLIARPCYECGMTRAKAMLPLLTSPKLRVFSKLVLDSATASDLLKIGGRRQKARPASADRP